MDSKDSHRPDTFVTENNDILTLTDTTSEGSKVYMSIRIRCEWESEIKAANLFFSGTEILVFYGGESKSRYSIDLKSFRTIVGDDLLCELVHPIKQGYSLEFLSAGDQDTFLNHFKDKCCTIANIRTNGNKLERSGSNSSGEDGSKLVSQEKNSEILPSTKPSDTDTSSNLNQKPAIGVQNSGIGSKKFTYYGKDIKTKGDSNVRDDSTKR